jgi:hypothetical protein
MLRQTVYMECRKTERKNGKNIVHHKFYQMSDNGDGTFTALFGKIDTDGREMIYPISKWSDVEYKRRQHGYEDVSRSTGIDPHAERRIKELNKINIVLDMLNDTLTFEKRNLRAYLGQVTRIKEKVENHTALLSKSDMIFLNDIYKQVREK